MPSLKKAYFLAFLSAALLGSSYIFFYLLLPNWSAGKILFYSYLLATGAAFAFHSKNLAFHIESIRKNKWPLLFAGACHGIGALLLLHSMRVLKPNIVVFLMQFVLVFVVAYSHIFLKERLSSLEEFGIAVVILGAFVMQWRQNLEFSLNSLIVVVSAALIATGDFLAKRYVRYIRPETLNLGRLFAMTLTGAAFVIFSGEGVAVTTKSLSIAIASGLLSGFLGWELFYIALKELELSKVNTIRALSPIFTGFYSYLLFGHIFTRSQWFGSLLIFIGVLSVVQGMRHRMEKV
ncbi:MAG: DMT family transporter [Candidatus Woesearchaeota archaeon]